MTFTDAATGNLNLTDKQVDYIFELRTNSPESSGWLSYNFVDFTLIHDAYAPASLRIELTNDDLTFSNEQSTAVRTQLLAEARLSASIGNEAEIVFQGRIQRVEPQDGRFTVYCHDWLTLVNECECEVSLVPEETAEIAPARSVGLVAGGAFGSVYGFQYDGSGNDPAFNTGIDPGSRRQSWAPGDIRVYYDAAGQTEVPPQHYQVNLTGGTVTILEDTAGQSYHVSGVRCFIEGTLDWADVFSAALTYPAADGGIGALPEDLDVPETGLDVAGPVYFRGRTGDLVRSIMEEQQANLRLWFDSRTGKYCLRVITQAEPGQENWQTGAVISIAQPRDIRELYSRVVVTGHSERPRNALTELTTTITSLVSQGNWFAWDGLNVGCDDSFAAVSPLLYDGDANRGAAVHNLAANDNGGTNKYDSWYDFVQIDLGAIERIQRVRLTLPGSRNINAAAGHQGLFWPGVKLFSSVDGLDWRLLSAGLCGRYQPGVQLDVHEQDLLCPRARYIKVQLGAYKHGFLNQDDPSIGLAELAIYLTESYQVCRSIQGADPSGNYVYSDGTQWCTYHPALWTRFTGRHRTRYVDRRGELNEYLAQDHALDLLAEGVRRFQQVTCSAVCDPRVRLYDTVAVRDEMNGDINGVLVERVRLSRSGTVISGTDYRAGALDSE